MSESVTGEMILRDAVKARLSRGPAAAVAIAQSCKVGVDSINNFAAGKAGLPVAALQLAAREIFGGNVDYDAAANLLNRRKIEPQPTCTAMPPSGQCATKLPTYPSMRDFAPKPVEPEKRKAPPSGRPGWLLW